MKARLLLPLNSIYLPYKKLLLSVRLHAARTLYSPCCTSSPAVYVFICPVCRQTASKDEHEVSQTENLLACQNLREHLGSCSRHLFLYVLCDTRS